MSEEAIDTHAIDTAFPAPPLNDLSRPFWEALNNDGALTFQRCNHCKHAWLPARSECPACLQSDWVRERASGNATLVSWVVYRHGYHPAWAQRLPYTVAVVNLEEGPRMISNVVGVDNSALRIDQPLKLVIEHEGALAVPRFTLK